MKKIPEHPCEGFVPYHGGWGRGRKCGLSGKVEREAHWYCLTHDPERVAARRDKRDAESKRKVEMWVKRWDENTQRKRNIEAVVRAVAAWEGDPPAVHLAEIARLARTIVDAWGAEKQA